MEADEKKLVIFYLSKGPVTLGNFPHISADVILISIGDKGLNVRIDNIIPLCYPYLVIKTYAIPMVVISVKNTFVNIIIRS